MKQELIMMILGILLSTSVCSQGVHIGSANSDPESSAILELESSSKGILIPRMTLAQMQAISTPAEGLMVFNTDSVKLNYYNGTRWLNGDGSNAYLMVGDPYQGGVIFYLDGVGGGLISATVDANASGFYKRPWGCGGTVTGATSFTNGSANTTAILAACGTANIAADLCDDYSSDGYTDWYLPSRNQLSTLYSKRDDVGGFESEYYWSSTERNSNRARTVRFSDGAFRNRVKNSSYRVRPIRTF